MDKIQIQASKLWELLFSEDTARTYQDALGLTGTIIQETAQLLWLLICSVFVFGAWFADASVTTGNNLRNWIDQQNNPSEGAEAQPIDFAEKGKSLLESGKSSAAYLLAQAREQLGLEPEPEKKKIASKPAAAQPSAPAPAATSTPRPTPVASQPSEQKPPFSNAGISSSADTSASSESAGPTGKTAANQEPVAAGVDEDVSREDDDGGWPPQAED